MFDIVLWLLVPLLVGFVTALAWWILAQSRISRERPTNSGNLSHDLTTSRARPTNELNIQNLDYELKEITDYFQLGIMLGLEYRELKGIDDQYTSTTRRMEETLGLWLLHTSNASWSDVVTALQKMNQNKIAERIHSKYITGASKFHL